MRYTDRGVWCVCVIVYRVLWMYMNRMTVAILKSVTKIAESMYIEVKKKAGGKFNNSNANMNE